MLSSTRTSSVWGLRPSLFSLSSIFANPLLVEQLFPPNRKGGACVQQHLCGSTSTCPSGRRSVSTINGTKETETAYIGWRNHSAADVT
jgi:hypothetical protein